MNGMNPADEHKIKEERSTVAIISSMQSYADKEMIPRKFIKTPDEYINKYETQKDKDKEKDRMDNVNFITKDMIISDNLVDAKKS